MNTAVMFSSKTVEWATPQGVFDDLDAEFRFTLDACATTENAKCAEWLDSADMWSALAKPWNGRVWCNPPYKRGITELWVKKGYEAATQGALVVMLLPARTDVAWWHDYVLKAAEIRFVRGRLKFGNAKSGAPFPSAVVVFRPQNARGRAN